MWFGRMLTDELAQCYLQLAALYGQCVVERAGLVQIGQRE